MGVDINDDDDDAVDEKDHDCDVNGMFVIIVFRLYIIDYNFDLVLKHFPFYPKNDFCLFEWAHLVNNNSVPAFRG